MEICAFHKFRQSDAIRMPGHAARGRRWLIARAKDASERPLSGVTDASQANHESDQ
jgi:hypothetical protein